jgi:hypothetical protein
MPPHGTTSSLPPPAIADQLAAIADVVHLYFDGIHRGDEYIEIVHAQPAPASLGAVPDANPEHRRGAPHGGREAVDSGRHDRVRRLPSIQSIAGTWMVVHKLFSDEVSAAG